VPQGVQCIQNLAGLEADLPAEGIWNPDHDLRHALFTDQPTKAFGELSCRHDREGTGEDATGVRHGHAGADLADVEGSNPPWDSLRERQNLLRAGEPTVEDLAHLR
jgi:hypothetical protein